MRIDETQATAQRQNSAVWLTDFRRPVHCLLGSPIDALSKTEVVARIRDASATRSPCWLSTSNVQYLIASQEDERFRDTVILSDLSVADGIPLIWIAPLLGVPIKERVAGADLFEALVRGEGGALKLFFFGGADGVAEMACERLNTSSGPLRCVGYSSPGFGTVEQMSGPEVIDLINRSGADFLVVALGAKKGQAWIARNRSVLNVPVVSHLGAVINFVAGTLIRAPVWMQDAGLEWLWRIKEEPALWRRYWSDAKKLLPLVFTSVLRGWAYRASGLLDGAPAPAKVVIASSDSSCCADDKAKRANQVAHVTLSGSWSEADMPLLRTAFETLCHEPRDIELDVSELVRVDGTFIALLMLLYGRQSKIGRTLVLLSPTKSLRRIFKLHCAEFLLGVSANAESRELTAE